jgi:hypothetical protein
VPDGFVPAPSEITSAVRVLQMADVDDGDDHPNQRRFGVRGAGKGKITHHRHGGGGGVVGHK